MASISNDSFHVIQRNSNYNRIPIDISYEVIFAPFECLLAEYGLVFQEQIELCLLQLPDFQPTDGDVLFPIQKTKIISSSQIVQARNNKISFNRSIVVNTTRIRRFNNNQDFDFLNLYVRIWLKSDCEQAKNVLGHNIISRRRNNSSPG